MTLLNQGYMTEHVLRDLGFKSVGNNVMIARDATIVGRENIEIGDNVRIDSYTCLLAVGGFIRLGSYIHIGTHCVLAAGEGITMEDFSGLSHGVKIYSKSDDFSGEYLTNPTVPPMFTNTKGGPVLLQEHVIIGSTSVILPNLTIGRGSAVGALSLVTKTLKPWGIYSGCPAKYLKMRSKKVLTLEQELKSR